MTVEELIRILMTCNPHAVVCIQHMDAGGLYEGDTEVTGVDWGSYGKIILS